mmetsp:Transcript_1215/g.1728  ORF Transcript_1215/g.1728 Transcript_1215/m.1728 type:complete len:215 (-) Transcript_1215:74-718(-)
MFRTGTTSLGDILNRLGYRSCSFTHGFMQTGNLKTWMDTSDRVVDDYINHWSENMRSGFRVMMNATLSTNDGPWLFFYKQFDEWYPGSKFVLTVRNSTRIHVNSEYSKGFRSNTTLKTILMQDPSKRPVVHRPFHKGLPVIDHMRLIARRYELHNAAVLEYFKGRENDLLELCVECDPEKALTDLKNFLGCPKLTGPQTFLYYCNMNFVIEKLS